MSNPYLPGPQAPGRDVGSNGYGPGLLSYEEMQRLSEWSLNEYFQSLEEMERTDPEGLRRYYEQLHQDKLRAQDKYDSSLEPESPSSGEVALSALGGPAATIAGIYGGRYLQEKFGDSRLDYLREMYNIMHPETSSAITDATVNTAPNTAANTTTNVAPSTQGATEGTVQGTSSGGSAVTDTATSTGTSAATAYGASQLGGSGVSGIGPVASGTEYSAMLEGTGSGTGSGYGSAVSTYAGPAILGALGAYGFYDTADRLFDNDGASNADIQQLIASGSNAPTIGAYELAGAEDTGIHRNDFMNIVNSSNVTGWPFAALNMAGVDIGLGSGKHPDQQRRDQWRDYLLKSPEEGGVGLIDDKYNITFADGTQFDIGRDGGEPYYNVGFGDPAYNTSNVDENNIVQFEQDPVYKDKYHDIVGALAPLSGILAAGDRMLTGQGQGYLTNAIVQTGGDPNAKVQDLVTQATGLTGMEARNALGTSIWQMYNDGLITSAERNARLAANDKTYNAEMEAAGQTNTTGYVAPLDKDDEEAQRRRREAAENRK